MNTLNRVILINSGGYAELEVPCDGHVQIVGMNGHGKTSLLRALHYYHVGNNDNASYGIHTNQRDFATHYLGNTPSYLIYEVQRSGEARPFHVAVTRPSNRVQFLFVDDAYDEGLYIDASRLVRSFEAVQHELDSRIISHESVSSYESFRQTIYGMRKSPFAVFRANSRASQQVAILPRIISGIFTVNRMNASRLKSALCCGLLDSPQSLRIDLRLLRNNLSDFQRINRAVKTYLSNQRAAETILELADQYEEFSAQLERQVRDFVARAKAVSEKEIELHRLLADETKKLKELETEHKEKQSEHQKKLDGLNIEIGKLEDRIERGEQREREYREKEIEKKAAEFETLPVLRQKQATAEARYQALTEKYESESKRRDELLNRLKQARDSAIASLQIRKSKCQEQHIAELDELRQKSLQKRQEIEEDEQEKVTALTPRRMKLKAEETNLAEAWKHFHQKQEPNALLRKRQEREQLNADLAAWEKRRETIQSEAKVAQARYESASAKLNHEREKLEDSLEREKNTLDEERQRLRAELDKMEQSIAGLIRRERPAWLPTAARTLARNFLFYDAASLEANIQANADSPLLGLNLNVEKLRQLEAIEVDPAVLQTQLTENQNARDAFAARAEQQRAEIDGKRDTLEKKRRQQIEAWDAEVYELKKSIRNGQNAKIDLSNTITNLENQWRDEREEGRRRLEQRDEDFKKQRRELEEADNQIRNEAKNLRRQVQDEEDKDRRTINERKEGRLKEIAGQIEEQENHYKTEADRVEAEFLKQLEAKGADARVIEEANKAAELTKKAVLEVEGHRSLVERYQQYKREEIEPLPGWRSRRQTLNEAVEAAETEWKTQSDSFSKREEESSELIRKFGDSLDDVGRDKKEIESFRKEPIAIEYLGLFGDDSLGPASDFVPGSLRDLAQSLRVTYDRLLNADKKGDDFTRRFLNKFEFRAGEENDLGFAPIPDGFKWIFFVGDRLRSFVRLNKIQHLRTLQTKQFDSIIRQIVREVSRVEDALRRVKATARKVQEDLAEDKFIDVLDAIELRVQDEPSELWSQLKRMERFQTINLGSESDLFQPQADESSVKEAIQAFETLVKHLDQERREALELEDSFEFTIRVIENGHDHGFRASLDHIGSTGTDYLVKMLIYLSLIDSIRGQALAGDDQAYLHCILDETGVLAPKYVKEAIRYAERKRILLITAGHSATSKGFRYWFRVRKRGKYFGGEQIISKHPQCG